MIASLGMIGLGVHVPAIAQLHTGVEIFYAGQNTTLGNVSGKQENVPCILRYTILNGAEYDVFGTGSAKVKDNGKQDLTCNFSGLTKTPLQVQTQTTVAGFSCRLFNDQLTNTSALVLKPDGTAQLTCSK